MYYIIDLRNFPPTLIQNLEFNNFDDACDWINQNGDATIFSIISTI